MNQKDLNKKIQKAMNDSGEKLEVDGAWGPKSSKASDKFDFKAILKQVSDVPSVKPTTGKGLLWYPKAKVHSKTMKAAGTFKHDYPVLILVHFTAGRYEKGAQNAFDSIDGGISNGYNYMCIAREGTVVQASPLNKWGYHAGESSWSKYLPKWVSGSVSDESVGIEMCNAGKLTKTTDGRYKTWFNTYISESDVRYVEEKDWGCPTGYYHKYSSEQEKALIDLCVWLIKNDPNGILNADHIVGHHEVAGKLGIGYWRKNDPGGSLSMSMSDFRKLIAEKL